MNKIITESSDFDSWQPEVISALGTYVITTGDQDYSDRTKIRPGAERAIVFRYRKGSDTFTVGGVNPKWVVHSSRVKFKSLEDAQKFIDFHMDSLGAYKISKSRFDDTLVSIPNDYTDHSGVTLYVSTNFLNYEAPKWYEKFKSVPMTESYLSKETVELEYTDLPIEVVVRRGNPGGYFSHSFGNWLPDDDETKEIKTDYTLEVDKSEIVTYIIENCMSAEDYNKFKDDEEAVKYVEEHIDDLVEKHEENIKSAYWDDARECAERDYEDEEPDYDDYDESYLNETWIKMETIGEDLIKELNDYLESKNCHHKANIVRVDGFDKIYFDITWGDWKHDHMRVWYLVNEFCKDRGYRCERDMITTETNGSDSYSAEHYFEVEYDDEMGPMYEGWLDDIRKDKNSRIKDAAGKASSEMGNLVSLLGSDNEEEWKAQLSDEDVQNMKDASNAAWLLYHYKNDGKVRPLHR